MNYSMLERFRKEVHRYYNTLLSGEHPIAPELERNLFSPDERFVSWAQPILNPRIRGRNYFVGKIMDQMFMTASHGQREYRIVCALPETNDFQGIKTFESYAGIPEKTTLPKGEMVIVIAESFSKLDDEIKRQIRLSLNLSSSLRSLKK